MNPTISNQSLLQGSTTATPTGKEKSGTTATGMIEQKPTAENLRTSLNRQIIEASMSVSIKSGDNSQELFFRTALQGIYEALGNTEGVNITFESRIMPNYQMPTMNDSDNPFATPEGTANVILSFSLGLYANYSASHSGEDEAKMASNFIELIRGGFEKGYGEAEEILKGLGVFDGSLAEEIGKTFELVQKGYDDWLADKLTSLQPAETGEAAETDGEI